MTKSQLEQKIANKVIKVISTYEELDTVKNNVGVRMYISHVLEEHNGRATGRNIGWYTVDEGTAKEAAYLRDEINHKNVAETAVQSYLASLVPTTYIRAKIDTVNEEERYAYCTAIKNSGNGTATSIRILVYKNGSSPITHVELV